MLQVLKIFPGAQNMLQVLERKEVELRNEVATITRYSKDYATRSYTCLSVVLYIYVCWWSYTYVFGGQAAAEREGGGEEEDEGGQGEAAAGSYILHDAVLV